jgi:hypothetical protein
MFRTDSINEAAFVVARGMSHPGFDWVTDKLCLFTFRDCDEAGRLVNEYKEGGMVEARRYAGTLAHLKAAMFDSRNKNKT